MIISEVVRDFRNKNNLTLRELASIIGISHSQLSKIERAEHKPSRDTLIKIAKVLEIDITTFLFLVI